MIDYKHTMNTMTQTEDKALGDLRSPFNDINGEFKEKPIRSSEL